MKAVLIIVFSLLSFNIGYAQNTEQLYTDSLKRQLFKTSDDSDRVKIMIIISGFTSKTNPDTSLKYAQDARVLAKQIKLYGAEAGALQILGLYYRGQGDIPKGLELFLEGLKIAEENNNKELAQNFLTNIGHLYRDLEDYDKAIIYYRRSNALSEELKDETQSSFLLWNIGKIYKLISKQDSASIYIQKANEKIKSQNSEIEGNGYLTMMAGDIEFQLGNRPRAFKYLYTSISISTQNQNYVDRSFAYLVLAGFFAEINGPDSSIYYQKKSLEDAQRVGIKRKILEASRLLATHYESIDLKTALNYRKIADSANEELYGAKKVQSLQKIITNEQDRLRQVEAQRVAAENRTKQNGLLTGIGLILLVAFLLYRNNLQKQKANKVLEATLMNLRSAQAQLVQSEKMASLGELTAGIAHEIQNPLNFVNNFSDVNKELTIELESELYKGNIAEARLLAFDIRENEEKINYHGKRADTIVKSMMEHSRAGTGVKEPTDINALTDEYLRLAYHGFRAKDKFFNATLVTNYDQGLNKINVIPQDIGRVLLNLYNNSFYALSAKSRHSTSSKPEADFIPEIKVTTQKIANLVNVTVKDNGNGIPEKDLEKVFQPFFTTKPTGQGTGLGLSLSYDIIKAHQGDIKINNRPGEGVEFIVTLPGN